MIQKDGKLVVAGSSRNGGGDDFALVRYAANGSLDVTFGTGGKVITPIGSGGVARTLVAQPDGRPIAAGSTFNGTDNDFALARYTAGGSLDATFGGDGRVTTSIGPGDDNAYALVLQKNDKPIAVGSSWNGTDTDFAVARYETNGAPNLPFGTAGITTVSVGSGEDVSRAAVEQDTDLIVGGTTSNGSNDDFGLARFILCAQGPC